MNFTPSTRLTVPDGGAICRIAAFSLTGNTFAVRHTSGGGFALPEAGDFPAAADALWCGDLSGGHVLAVELAEDAVLPSGCSRRNLREAPLLLSGPECTALCRGVELASWRRQTRYCGRCGAALTDAPKECARVCPVCGGLYFPVIAPAVIVLITLGREILLAHNRRFKAGLFGLIAGFVESGETPEQAVAREVAEEVGIRVRNVRYWGSQCWPFPHSLMLGFRAEYDSGEIVPDGNEIGEAAFFAPDHWPNTPAPGSIAYRMLEEYRKELLNRKEEKR